MVMNAKQQYRALTRDLMWNFKHIPREQIFPLAEKEGIIIKNPARWEDPFRLTYNQYMKIQSEKDHLYHTIRSAFEANHGHTRVVDSRWFEGVKAFAVAVQPGEYAAHRLMAYIGRHTPVEAIRFAAFNQALDELRHSQIELKHYSHMARYYDGFHSFADANENLWFNTVPKSFFEDALTAGPWEALVAVGFSFEYTFTNILFLPFAASAAAVGDDHFAALGKSVQSDEARHMALGLTALKMLLEEDDRNVPIVQKWIDKWYWRCYRVFSVVATLIDYYPRHRATSWKEAFKTYVEEQVLDGLFGDLRKYGIRPPLHAEDSIKEKEHYSHAVMTILNRYKHANVFRGFQLQPDDYQWLNEQYPDTFDKYYAPELRKLDADPQMGLFNPGIPAVCSVCQIPLELPNPDKPDEYWIQYSEFGNKTYMTCSPGCKHIFDMEPAKYSTFWFPAEAYLSHELGGNLPGDLFKSFGFGPEEGNEHYSSQDYKRWLEYRKQMGWTG